MRNIDRNTYIGRSQDLNLYDITIESAQGHEFTDINGRSYIDFSSSASSLPLGYSRDDLVEAYVRQCKKVPHTCTVYTYSEIVQEYAKALTESSKIPGAKMLFGAFGSDAVDGALKTAQVYTGKERILAFERSYHGGTFLSLAATGFKGVKKGLNLPTCFTHLPYPQKESYKDTLKSIEQELDKGDVGALFMETILGDGGIIETDGQFFHEVIDLLHAHNAILILDEIQTGIGRTGTFWGYEQYGFLPDLFIAGKALGGGYVPLSASIGRPEIIDSLQKCQNAFTLSGHATSCAVGLQLLRAFEDESILKNVQLRSANLFDLLHEELMGCSILDEVRGRGLMIGIALKSDKSIGAKIGSMCLDRGVYIGYYGNNNNVLRVHPHLNIDEETMRTAAMGVVDAIKAFAKNPQLDEEDVASFFTT
tara:strand:- start:2178 stop:3443 length:1266 start_codon:yes stop_codon:yes gene_type:complete